MSPNLQLIPLSERPLLFRKWPPEIFVWINDEVYFRLRSVWDVKELQTGYWPNMTKTFADSAKKINVTEIAFQFGGRRLKGETFFEI